jgi:hypothetical protein
MQLPININQCPNSVSFAETNDVILLVQGDTNPPLIVSLTNEEYNTISGNTTITPIDVSTANVELKLRKINSNTVFANVAGTQLAGVVDTTTGEVSANSPYDVAGVGGRVAFYWSSSDLLETGMCEGEIKITFSNATIQTVYNLVPLKIRPKF